MTPVIWILRIGIFGTFLGHGIYALSKKAAWLPYLSTIGFSSEMSQHLMPIIGVLDILVALVVLIKPNKYVLIYAVFWAFATAIIRPISGEPFLEFVERSANWAAPLALLLLLRFQQKNDIYNSTKE